MLTGRVSSELLAWLSVEILDADGQPHPVEVVLDTGFEGYLGLPPLIIQQLALTPAGHRYAELANGGRVRVRFYVGTVLWNGRSLEVDVIETGNAPLLGMALLQGSRVTLDVRYGGPVTVTPLP